jgi:hypothetical protein
MQSNQLSLVEFQKIIEEDPLVRLLCANFTSDDDPIEKTFPKTIARTYLFIHV